MIGSKKSLNFHDILYFLLLVVSFYFTRNIVCSMLMVLFFGYTMLQQMLKIQKPVVPYFCVGTLVFILYGALNIVIDNVISADVAKTMVVSITLNLMMTYAIIQYVVLRDDITCVLRVTEASIFFTALIVVMLSFNTILQQRLAKGTEINANMLAILCVCGFVLSLYFQKTKTISMFSCCFRCLFYIATVMLTGSRKGIIMLVAAIVIINILSGKRKIIRGIVVGVVVITILYWLIMNVDFLYNIIGVRIQNLITLLTEGAANEGSLKSRQKLVEIGIGYIKEKPWTGYGLDCFKLVSGFGSGGMVNGIEVGYYSHNNYVELLFGTGIIGLILYYIPILSVLKKMLRSLKKNVCVSYLIAFFVTKLMVEYAYVSYYSRIDAYVVAAVVGCVVVAEKQYATYVRENDRIDSLSEG